jgi:hypothetical protein
MHAVEVCSALSNRARCCTVCKRQRLSALIDASLLQTASQSEETSMNDLHPSIHADEAVRSDRPQATL